MVPQHLLISLPSLILLPRRLLPPQLLNLPALWHLAVSMLGAALCMNHAQHPHLLAGRAASRGPHLTGAHVLEHLTDLETRVAGARQAHAARRMLHELNRPLDALVSALPLLICQPIPSLVNVGGLERVGVTVCVISPHALDTDLKVTA